MKKFMKEFRDFAVKGNVFDLAVGIIIGGAFGKIVSSFVNDLFMPLISLILGKTNLADLKVVLSPAIEGKEQLAIRYGLFLQTTMDFILIALVVFIMIKMISTFKKKEESKPAQPAGPTTQEKLLMEIRDLLKK